MDDALGYFIGGMLSGIFVTLAISAVAIIFYKTEVRDHG